MNNTTYDEYLYFINKIKRKIYLDIILDKKYSNSNNLKNENTYLEPFENYSEKNSSENYNNENSSENNIINLIEQLIDNNTKKNEEINKYNKMHDNLIKLINHEINKLTNN
jgi:hypothetical protein